jgi:hypothetical protein
MRNKCALLEFQPTIHLTLKDFLELIRQCPGFSKLEIALLYFLTSLLNYKGIERAHRSYNEENSKDIKGEFLEHFASEKI